MDTLGFKIPLFQVGVAGSGGVAPADNLWLFETGDSILFETGDVLVVESA